MVTDTEADLEALEKLIGALSPEQIAKLAALPGVRDKLREIIEQGASQ